MKLDLVAWRKLENERENAIRIAEELRDERDAAIQAAEQARNALQQIADMEWSSLTVNEEMPNVQAIARAALAGVDA